MEHPATAPFTRAEYAARLRATRTGMAALGLDVLVASSPENLYYLSGYESTGHFAVQALLVPIEGDPVLITRGLERPNVAATYVYQAHVGYQDHDEPVAVVARELTALGAHRGRVGIEKSYRYVSIANLERLQALLPDARLENGSAVVASLRLRKSEAELGYIRAAAQILDRTMRACFDAIRPGRGENEIMAEVYRANLAGGSEYIGSPLYLVSGPRSSRPHTAWSDRRVQPGEPMFIELGSCVRRYHAAMMRPAVAGPVAERLRTMCAVSREGLEAALAALKPGATSGDVDRACRETIRRAGWGDAYHHRTGYSIGMGFPHWGEGHVLSIREDDPTPIEAGMVFHVVPYLMIEGEVGLAVSETVIVTESGAEALGTVPREIAES
jgi:Xaa-Pro dipeptidase